ncbi:Late embryogenesis abundant (LEA) hydroxyproline-rich glycoprotein family [Quillaja saponaria]|uniref:Late embryogenesis abundant (LEA) hydroxyproline-rich glycoprotein family n=1 Tax=Quillaja saponaria TaxID=32244 RepID=A0AAD7VHS4_QUISA|nr:Late embryogenesis abundant (LEA) hydroxyproline-rich glycoprotein family [Quillaja saponaria]
MASSLAQDRDKTVTGYPAQPGQVAAGYPHGSGYPYAIPPPPTYSTTYQPGPTRYYQRIDGPSLLCRLITAASVVFAIIGLIFFITWLVLKPHLPEFRVDSASVSSLNATGTELTATWDFTLFVRNPNHKLRINYDSVEATVLYGDDVRLATSRLPPFLQETKNETRVQFQLAARSEYVGEDVVKRVSGERAHGSVNFGVTVYAWIRFRSGIWRMRQHLLKVYCDPVSMGFSPNNATGTLLGQSRSCEVDLNSGCQCLIRGIIVESNYVVQTA